MSVKNFFANLVRDVANSVARFIAAFCFTLILFISSSLFIILEPERGTSDIYNRIILMSLFGILFCTFGKLLYEKFKNQSIFKRIRLNVSILLALISGLSYFALYDYKNPYIVMGYCGIMSALFVGIIYLTITDSVSKTFAQIFSKTVFNATVCGIVTLGTSLCIYAFHTLVYECSRSTIGKVYSVNSLFIWAVLFLNLSLSIIPHKNVDLKTSGIFKTIALYAAFPVYMVLIAVLYLYSGKILVTLSFPSGQISWLASFASLVFVFFIFSLEQFKEENKLAKLFVKFGGYFIIPIIVVQFIAIYIRLSNYGLTTARFISVSLSVIALVFAVVTLIRNCRYIQHMLLVLAGASLLLTFTPINVLDVPAWNQASRLITALNKNSMIADGKIVPIVPGENVPQEDRIIITSAYRYLINSGAKKPAIIESYNDKFKDVFGFDRTYGEEWPYPPPAYEYVHYSRNYDSFDIGSYSVLYVVSDRSHGKNRDPVFAIEPEGGNPVSFDLMGALEMLYQQHGKTRGNVDMEFSVGDGKLILTEARFQVDHDNKIINIHGFEGYYLKK
jgi:hypothetical protein